jgi:hypothetical protein
MSYTAESIPDKPMAARGMDDSQPINQEATFYQTRGAFFGRTQELQRCNGKLLLHKFPVPVLAIHGDQRGCVFIETTTTLYMFNSLTDAIPT